LLGVGIIVAVGIAGLRVRARNRPDTPAPVASSAGNASAASTPPARSGVQAAAAIDSASPPDSASALIDAARVEVAAGRFAEALALYQRAQGLEPRPATLLEIGRMLHRMGRCREAWRATQGAASSPESQVAADARELLERIGRCD
jgi:hypothetical protein